MHGLFHRSCLVWILGVILHFNTGSSNSENVALEYLDNCDPNVDPFCTENLDTLRDQIEFELFGEARKDDQSSPEIASAKGNSVVDRTSKLQDTAKGQELQRNHGRTWKDKDDGSDSAVLSKKSVEADSHDKDDHNEDDIPVIYFLIIVVACTLTGVAGVALSGYCWYKLHQKNEKENKKDYIPGVKKNSAKSSPVKSGDRKLDYKAEMYHYVHTKNQIAAMEKAKNDHLGNEDLSNDEEDDVEDYTVYECPGLAPTGDMTVVNPLFSDQEVTGSDEGRPPSNRSSPSTPPLSPNQSSSH